MKAAQMLFVARAQLGCAGIAVAQNLRARSTDDIIYRGNLLRPYCQCLDKCLGKRFDLTSALTRLKHPNGLAVRYSKVVMVALRRASLGIVQEVIGFMYRNCPDTDPNIFASSCCKVTP